MRKQTGSMWSLVPDTPGSAGTMRAGGMYMSTAEFPRPGSVPGTPQPFKQTLAEQTNDYTSVKESHEPPTRPALPGQVPPLAPWSVTWTRGPRRLSRAASPLPACNTRGIWGSASVRGWPLQDEGQISCCYDLGFLLAAQLCGLRL